MTEHLIKEQNKYLKTKNIYDSCSQQNTQFNDCVSKIQKHLLDQNLHYIVGGIGFDETLITDGIINNSSTAVIIRFFINQNGDIHSYNNKNQVHELYNIESKLKDDIIFINSILSKPYVINQIKNLPTGVKQANHQHVFCLLNTQSKNLLNYHGFGNTFIGSDKGLLELFQGGATGAGGAGDEGGCGDQSWSSDCGRRLNVSNIKSMIFSNNSDSEKKKYINIILNDLKTQVEHIKSSKLLYSGKEKVINQILQDFNKLQINKLQFIWLADKVHGINDFIHNLLMNLFTIYSRNTSPQLNNERLTLGD